MRIGPFLKRSTISGRLTAFSAVFIAAAVVVASATLWLIVANVVREQIDQRLDVQIQALRGALIPAPDGTVALSTQLDGPPFDRPASGWFWQITGDGIRLGSRSLAGGTIETPGKAFEWRQLLDGMPRHGDSAEFGGQELHTRTMQASVNGKIVTITATAPRTALTGPAFRSLIWLLGAMFLLGGSLLLGTVLQVRFGLRPLRMLSADIESVLQGRRSAVRQPDVHELQPIASEINRLIDQNTQRLVETRLHFANMAHGLKTPVASLMLALNDGNDADGSIRQLTERIDKRIRHHLADGRRASAGDGLSSVSLIRPRLDDLILALGRIYADKRVSVACDVEPSLAVRCTPDDFDEIFGNILDNAFKWAAGNISVSAQVSGLLATIRIGDDGAGMPESRIEDAFRPGLRLDEAIAGDGFGLSISKELAELYGGRIAIAPAKPGLTVEVTLPAAPHAA